MDNDESISQIEPSKPKRGRPKRDSGAGTPKSDAERARLYRLRKKMLAEANCSKGEPAPASPADYKDLAAQISGLTADLAAMTAMAELLIQSRQTHKTIPKDVFANICKSHLAITMKHNFL